jgi:MSHA biogenesis protein MshQ
MRGDSNAFVVKPDYFQITLDQLSAEDPPLSATGPDSEIFTSAGTDFGVTVTAMNADNEITPNYGNENDPETIALTHTLVKPTIEEGGVAGELDTSPGPPTGVNYSFSVTANWSEVGIINLIATVDGTDGANYLGASADDATTTLSNVGRFTPASLSLTVIKHGTFINAANTDFTYVGQLFSYDPDNRPSLKVTALNASSPATLTSNYSGAWGKLNADSIKFTEPTSDEIQHGTPKPDGTSTRMVLIYAQDAAGFRDPTITANQPAAVKGIFDAAFTNDEFTYDKDSYSQISPFTPNVNLIITNVTDADGISTGSITLNPTGPGPIRFGRMRMYPTHGSEIEPLEMAYRLEYFNSPDWLLHEDKNSTIITDDISSEPTGISANSIEQAMLEGKFYITLSPPGEGNDGAYTITTDVLGSGEPWLQYDWEGDGNFDDNPRSTATFGIYKGDSHQIFSRQAFQ